MATRQIAYGAWTSLTVTNLQSLASSATAGWQSARISNLSALAIDYEIAIKLPMANTAAANDKCVYPFISKAVTTDGGTTWVQDDQGTTTMPTGTEGTTTIGTAGGNLSQATALVYTATQQTIQKSFMLSTVLGNTMPDGFSIILINYTGAALSTGCVVAYRAITETIS